MISINTTMCPQSSFMNYATIAEMDSELSKNILCIPISIWDPKKSRGSDYVTTLMALDSTGASSQIRFFTKYNKYCGFFKVGLPLRIFGLRRHDSKTLLADSECTVECIGDEGELDEYESDTVTKLRLLFNERVPFQPPRKLKRICDLEPEIYFDFSGKLVQKMEDGHTILFFVDGTSNKLIASAPTDQVFQYKMDEILYIKVWANNECADLVVGKSYLLKNLRIRQIEQRLFANLSEMNKMPITEVPLNIPTRNIESVYNDIAVHSFGEVKCGLNYMAVNFLGTSKRVDNIQVCTVHERFEDETCTSDCHIVEIKATRVLLGIGDESIMVVVKDNLINKLHTIEFDETLEILLYKERVYFHLADILNK